MKNTLIFLAFSGLAVAGHLTFDHVVQSTYEPTKVENLATTTATCDPSDPAATDQNE